MDKKTSLKLILSLALLIGASVLVVQSVRGPKNESDGRIYFYDESKKVLFAAPRNSVPPIRGVDDAQLDGVRAIVISPTGNTRDKKNRRIAYLEKYTMDLKAQFEAVQNGASDSGPGALRRGQVPANTLVRRENESRWHAVSSPEGEKIVTEWNVPGPDGAYPAVCVP